MSKCEVLFALENIQRKISKLIRSISISFLIRGENQAGERKVKYQVINIHLERTVIHLFLTDQGSHRRISLAMIDDPLVQVIF